MTGTIIYVGTHAITEGQLEVARQFSVALGEFLEANHPRMAHFGIYIDDESSTMTVIQIHPDEASLFEHLRLAGEKIAQAYEFLDGTRRIDIYGEPSDALVARVELMAMGAPVGYLPPDAGFSRLPQLIGA